MPAPIFFSSPILRLLSVIFSAVFLVAATPGVVFCAQNTTPAETAKAAGNTAPVKSTKTAPANSAQSVPQAAAKAVPVTSAQAAEAGNAFAVRPGVRKSSQKSLQRFTPKAFGRDVVIRPNRPLEPVPYSVVKHEDDKGRSLAGNENISFSAERKLPAEGVAARRAPLPGARDTMSQFDGPPPPEVAMRYQMRNGTSARLAVNPQDPSSPIYAPVLPGRNMDSAGVYLDMELRKDLQLQLGGEYRDLDADSGGRPEKSTGASMGFKLNF